MDHQDQVTVRCAEDWAAASDALGDVAGALVREVGFARHHGAGPYLFVLLDLEVGGRGALLNFVAVRDFSVDPREAIRSPEAVSVDDHGWTVDFGVLRVEAEHCNVYVKQRQLAPSRRLIVAPSAGPDVGLGDAHFDLEYLQRIEALAQAVVEASAEDGCLAFNQDEEEGQSDVQRSINRLARKLKMAHWSGDGCVPEHGEPGD